MEFDNPKLFVGGLSEEIDNAKLREYFSEYGEVKHVYVNSGKRIGFVTFSDTLTAKNALQNEEHIIFGSKVDVKPAKPRTDISSRKVFVGGLPHNITQETFKEYFENYGTMIDSVIIPDKERGRFRGFGFVTYDSEEAALNVLRQSFHRLNDKMVEVKRAKPKENMRRTSPAAVEMNGIYNVNTQPQPDPGRYVFDSNTQPQFQTVTNIPGGYDSTQPQHVTNLPGRYVFDHTGLYVWVPDVHAPMYGCYEQAYYQPNPNPWLRTWY